MKQIHKPLSASFQAYRRIFDTKFLAPSETQLLGVGGHFHVEYVFIVASVSIIGFHNVWHRLAARNASESEEINKNELTSVKDVEQMNLVAMTINQLEIQGFGANTNRIGNVFRAIFTARSHKVTVLLRRMICNFFHVWLNRVGLKMEILFRIIPRKHMIILGTFNALPLEVQL